MNRGPNTMDIPAVRPAGWRLAVSQYVAVTKPRIVLLAPSAH